MKPSPFFTVAEAPSTPERATVVSPAEPVTWKAAAVPLWAARESGQF